MRTPHSCLVFVALLGGSAALSSAENLLQNGVFARGISPWEANDAVAAFSPLDAGGDAASGSIRATTSSQAFTGGGVLSECIPVVAGAIYQHRYDYLIEPSDGIHATVAAEVDFYIDSTCSVVMPGGPGIGGEDTTLADGAWHASSDLIDLHQAPAGARGARLSLQVLKPLVEGSATALFDNVVFKALDVVWLNNGRFQVTASWSTAEASGRAHGAQLTNDTGYLWFFDPNNVEVVIKVLDACDPFGRFWVFVGGLTNVEVDIVVTDLHTGRSKTYHNNRNVPFTPVQDTNTFATCDSAAYIASSGLLRVSTASVGLRGFDGTPRPH